MMWGGMRKGCRAANVRVVRRTVTLFASLLSAVSILVFPGCVTKTRRPDLGGLYNRSAQVHGMERNPVIVIPGLLGSKLIQSETEKVVWGAFGGGAANPQKPDGARLVALPMREGAALHELSDDVYPAGVLDSVKIKMLAAQLTGVLDTVEVKSSAAGSYETVTGDITLVDGFTHVFAVPGPGVFTRLTSTAGATLAGKDATSGKFVTAFSTEVIT